MNSMNCEQALLLLSGHLDGENTPSEETALQAHLAQCATCRAVLQAYEAADCAMASLAADPPAALSEGVLRQLDRPAPARRRRLWYGAAAAALLVLVVAAGSLSGPGPDRDTAVGGDAAVARAFTADIPSDTPAALTVELVDDPAHPAAEAVPQLAELTACVTGSEVSYWTDVQTARAVIESCGSIYTLTVPDALSDAAPDAPCAIRIIPG